MYLYGNSFTEHLCKYLLCGLTGSQSIEFLEALLARLAPFCPLAFVGASHLHMSLLQTYLTVGKDVVMVGLGDCKFQIQLLHWSLEIMHTGTRHSLKGCQDS